MTSSPCAISLHATTLSLLVAILILVTKASNADGLSASTTAGGGECPGRSGGTMPRILCLHGKSQTGLGFSRKIGGARRKLERAYDLHFLDGPIVLDGGGGAGGGGGGAGGGGGGGAGGGPSKEDEEATARAWFLREEVEGGDGDGPVGGTVRWRHVLIPEAFDYVVRTVADRARAEDRPEPYYDAMIGFSQGGTLATALAASGAVRVRAVVTAGSPYVPEAFDVAARWAEEAANGGGGGADGLRDGMEVPKLHLAGETDAMIPVESTKELCERGGNGRLVLHEKGHLFPTRAAHVDRILKFLEEALA